MLCLEGKLNLGINEKGKIPEIISLEELQGYTLSQDKVSGKL